MRQDVFKMVAIDIFLGIIIGSEFSSGINTAIMTLNAEDNFMGIRQRIKKIIFPVAEKFTVDDVRIGLGYTAVRLDTGHTGLAYTFLDGVKGGCEVFKGIRPIIGRRAAELLAGLDSKDHIESAVALAAANAVSATTEKPFREGDIIDQLHLGPEDRVGMVGHFAPILPRLKKRCAAVHIFERIEFPMGEVLPEKDIPKMLPRCDAAIITATSIVNNTVDAILEAAKDCRQVVVLGASTPLVPQAFSGTPVTLLSGVVANQPEQVLQVVSQGGGMRSFGRHVRKVNLRV